MIVLRRFLQVVVFVALVVPHAAAQSSVFVVRHAERADAGSSGSGMMASDPDLSDAGRARAEALASMLRSADITAIFVTEYKRTRQTAAPLARILGLQMTTVGARDTAKLPAMIRRAKGNVLIVGHSNTVPAILKELGTATPAAVDDSEHDNLFGGDEGPAAHDGAAALPLRRNSECVSRTLVPFRHLR